LEELVTSPTPQHARTNALVRGWRAFRVWRRTRPFWGGLFTILAGLEIFATTQGSLGGLTFQMGPTGFLSWLIPTILVACGVLMWVTPGQRMFYAIVAAMTAVFSLIGVNLGGFLIGLLLGMVGSALGFAWTPVAPPQPVTEQDGGDPDAKEKPTPADETTVDTLLDGPDMPPPHESDVDVTGEIPAQPRSPGRSQIYTITVVLLSLAVVGVVTLRGGTPAHAAPCKPDATPSAPAPTSTPAPSTTATPAPEDGAEEGGGNIITDIIEGIGDLIGIGGGENEQAPAAESTPTPTPSGTQAPGQPADPTPAPTCPPASAPGGDQPGGADGDDQPVVTRVLPPPSDITAVNRVPSIMTGSKLTNYNLEYHGVTDLPLRGGGTMKVLWFNMTKAVTDNFELKPAVPGNRRMSIKAFPLTVEGSVRFFTPRFTGKLLGLDQVYTPSSPPPLIPGVPVPVLPITFTDIEIQLAYVDCGTLTAKKLLNTP
jgi:hypothetical protein